MPEPKAEKRINGQDGNIQKLSEQLKKLQEESTERENKLISDLNAQHINLISALEVRHSQQMERLQAESTERERKLLNDYKAEHQARFRTLVIALLRAKLQRDGLFLAVAWIAVAGLVAIAFRGLIHENLSKVFVFAALAGFVGTIIFVGQNLKNHSMHLKSAAQGAQPDVAGEEDDGVPLRFLIFGLISTVFLGLTLFMNFPGKAAVSPSTTGLSDKTSAASSAQTTEPLKGQAPSSSTASVPGSSSGTSPAATEYSLTSQTSTVTGNGGNFTGGNFGK